MPPKLLISITTPAEALFAYQSGADIIDIKDPTAGPLGMPSLATIQSIVDVLQTPASFNNVFSSTQDAGRRTQDDPSSSPPLSLALGELADIPHSPLFNNSFPRPETRDSGLGTLSRFSFAKTAFANAPAHWPTLFQQLFQQLPNITPVLALYAPLHPREAQALGPAHADPIGTITLAHQAGAKGILLDTFTKNGQSLLDSLYFHALPDIIAHTHSLGLWIALAGSLRLEHLPKLLPLNPDILGFRGAVCTNHNRTASIDPQKIQQLKQALTHTHNTLQKQ